MTFDYQGITTLITGASTGIGKVMAEELAKRGSHLILTARSQDKLEAIAANLRLQFNIQVHVFCADLSEPEGPKKLFDSVVRSGLAVDLLINNAGFGLLGRFEKSQLSEDLKMIQVNISALTALTHLFLPAMIQKGSASKSNSINLPQSHFGASLREGREADEAISEKKSGLLHFLRSFAMTDKKSKAMYKTTHRFSCGVINVASTASFQPLPKLALYAATKAFVLSLTEALWAENKNHGVKFFCLCPGNTASEFHDKAGMDKRFRFLQARTEDLVNFGLDVFANTHRITAVHGLLNKILSLGYRFFPRKVVVGVTSLLYR